MECVANIFMNEMKKVKPENKFTKNSDTWSLAKTTIILDSTI
jgi:hypothetical protein